LNERGLTLNAVIIDDEYHAINELSYYLTIFNVDILGVFTSPESGYECIVNMQPDIVFLDVDMPKTSGLELGISICRTFPDISIVFVTAYPQYALDSFAAHPVDFVLKPIDDKQLFSTIEHIRSKLGAGNERPHHALKIKCFGKFEVYIDDREIRFSTHKAKELLAYLLCKTSKPVFRDDIVRTIFDTGLEKKNANNFRVTLYRLRHTLMETKMNKGDLQINDDCSIQIKHGICDLVDFLRFADLNALIDQNNIDQATQIIDSLRDDLYVDIDALWVNEIRGLVSTKAEELLWKITIYYIDTNQHLKAEYILLKLIDLNPLFELGHTTLLDLCITTNNKGKYIYYYKKYARISSEELFCKPDKKYMNIFEKYNS
jgi:two-component SAPR family response regulator